MNLLHIKNNINDHICKILMNYGSSENYISMQLTNEIKVLVPQTNESFLMVANEKYIYILNS